MTDPAAAPRDEDLFAPFGDLPRPAMESAIQFIETSVATERCDSEAVADCVRCNAVAVARWLKTAIEALAALAAARLAVQQENEQLKEAMIGACDFGASAEAHWREQAAQAETALTQLRQALGALLDEWRTRASRALGNASLHARGTPAFDLYMAVVDDYTTCARDLADRLARLPSLDENHDDDEKKS